MASFLSDPQSFAFTVTGILTVCGLAFFAVGFFLDSLRNHRARTADRQASSFVWRA